MKLFQAVQNNLAAMGVNLNQPIHKNIFNKHILVLFSLCCFCIIFISMYIIQDANSFDEYTEPIYELTSAISNIIAFLLTILKFDTFIEFIERSEKIVNSSE